MNPSPMTVVHGDFHPGNVVWLSDDPVVPVRIIDWEEVGVGSGPQELARFLIFMGVLDHAETRMSIQKDLVRAYYDELVRVNSSIADNFSYDDCFRQFVIGGMRDSMRWLPVTVKWKPDIADYLVNQLETFRDMHGLQSEMLRYPSSDSV